MATIDIVPAAPAHIDPVAAHMRAADVAEIWAASHSTPRDSLVRSLSLSALAWCGMVDGVPACLFGVGAASILSGTGAPWLLGTDAVAKHANAFLRRNRPYVAQMLRAFPMLANHVDARNRLSVRWLRWLGFHVGPAIPWGADNLPFHPFEMKADV